MSDKIKIGWSEVDITPKQKISLAGQLYERITDEVESPISITGFALESGNEQMIICACDIVSVAQNLNELVKEKLKDRLPFSTDKVILCAIHDHTSYVYKRRGVRKDSAKNVLKRLLPEDIKYVPLVSDEGAMSPQDALDFLVEKITEAAVQAWENRAEGYYANGFGRACVGMNRRAVYDDGSAKMWGDTNLASFVALEGGNDSGIELIYTYDKNKKLTGVVANIACPAQVVEQRSFISSDYWGKVKEYLRESYGPDFKVLGLCSAAGDQCPRDLVRWVEPETPIDDPQVKRPNPIEHRADPSMYDVSGMKLVGKRIANEIRFVLEETKPELKDEGILIHETVQMELPLRRVTMKEYNDALEHIRVFIDRNHGRNISAEENAELYIYTGTMSRYETQQTMNTFFEEIHFLRFGDIAIATNPFELFLDYGNQIRARSKAKQTFLIQLACGADGYLPTEKAEQGSHYSAYVTSGVTGHVGGDLLVRETLTHINRMFD